MFWTATMQAYYLYGITIKAPELFRSRRE